MLLCSHQSLLNSSIFLLCLLIITVKAQSLHKNTTSASSRLLPPIGYCQKLNKTSHPRLRTPKKHGFVLPNGIVIETKGYFLPADRTKHLAIKAQHPNIDLRFIFQNPNQKLNKTSRTTYADWCKKHGFAYASKRIPAEWLTEPHNKTKIEAVQEVLKHTKNH